MTASWQWRATVEDADVVQSQETTLKDIVSLAVLAVHPPGKVEQEFVEHPLQEVTVSLPSSALLDFVHAPCSPGMNGRVYITECPLIGG